MAIKIPAAEDIKLVNCADCGRDLIGKSNRWYFAMKLAEQEKYGIPEAGRILGRPYCGACDWILFGGDDHPGMEGISDADAFAYLEQRKNEGGNEN